MSETGDVLIVCDTEGACYAIPLVEMQGYRLPSEVEDKALSLLNKASQNAAWGEVAGYGFMMPMAALFSPPVGEPIGQDQQNDAQIQRLMSDYNLAQALASNVQK